MWRSHFIIDPRVIFLKSLRYRTKRVCAAARHVLGRGHAKLSLEKWIAGYFEVLWTQCYWISVCVFIFCSTLCLILRPGICLPILFSLFVFIILFVVLSFAACWVHTGYSAFKIHSCETCVLNSAAICCRKRTYSWSICVRALYVLFMSQILYVMCFSSLLFTGISQRRHIVESLSQYAPFFLLLLFSFHHHLVKLGPSGLTLSFTECRVQYIALVLFRLVLRSGSCLCDILAQNSLWTSGTTVSGSSSSSGSNNRYYWMQ